MKEMIWHEKPRINKSDAPLKLLRNDWPSKLIRKSLNVKFCTKCNFEKNIQRPCGEVGCLHSLWLRILWCNRLKCPAGGPWARAKRTWNQRKDAAEQENQSSQIKSSFHIKADHPRPIRRAESCRELLSLPAESAGWRWREREMHPQPSHSKMRYSIDHLGSTNLKALFQCQNCCSSRTLDATKPNFSHPPNDSILFWKKCLLL